MLTTIIFFFRIVSSFNIMKTHDTFGAYWVIVVFPYSS